MAKQILIFALAFAALSSAIFAAAACSANAYKAACASCPFDASGKMDRDCYNSETDKALTCISAAYPVLNVAYAAGKCPDVKVCRTALEFCKDSLRGASDKEDCGVAAIRECYSDADTCLEKANQKCDVKLEDVARACPIGMGIIALCFLAVLARR